MTNLNLQGPNICDEELRQLSRDVADWILRLGRHEEKAEQITKDLESLEHSRQAPAQLKPSESEDTHNTHEHQQNISKQCQLFEG